MSKNVIVKLIVAGAALFGMYKLYKVVDAEEKKKADELKKHRDEVLEEINGELHEAEEWNKEIKDLTLNNTNLKPSDRAYAYEIFKARYKAVEKAKTIDGIDKARKDLEELVDILMNVTDKDTLEKFFEIEAEKKAYKEKLREERAAREAELEKYRKISDVIERLGTRAICKLMQ